MADVAASVLARLKNKAAESGRSYQLCLQLFCQEEFLRRLEKSKYAENLVLKGGLFIYALTDFDSRVTMDVDFLLRRIPNTPEQLRAVMEEIIAAPTENDFITFEIKSVEPISVAKKYAGVGASLIARIKNTRTPFRMLLFLSRKNGKFLRSWRISRRRQSTRIRWKRRLPRKSMRFCRLWNFPAE